MRFSIIEDKLEAIKALKYSTTLKNLKHYLDLKSYLRNNVYYFVYLVNTIISNIKDIIIQIDAF